MANGKTSGNLEQRARFIETARALGADEDEAAFKVKLGVIARQKPKADPTPAKDAGHDDRRNDEGAA